MSAVSSANRRNNPNRSRSARRRSPRAWWKTPWCNWNRPSRAETLSHPVRRIVIQGPLPGRRRSDRPARDQIVLLTNLLDVPAEIIALVYRHRWLIELFFRFLKHVLGCRRLLSEHPHGITLQVYSAILACLLLAEATGGSLNRRGYELVSLYLMGWAEEDELIAGLARLRAAALKQRRSSPDAPDACSSAEPLDAARPAPQNHPILPTHTAPASPTPPVHSKPCVCINRAEQ